MTATVSARASASPRFSGIVPMLYAFFDAAGWLDRGAMRAQVEACLGAGAHSVAVLGLATEIGKLMPDEKRTLISWAAEDLGRGRPLVVTISGASVAEQTALARFARDAGAAWLILQPPAQARELSEAELAAFFGAVMSETDLPVAIQNAPEYLGVGLSPEAVAALARDHANFTLLKGEGPATTIRQVIERAPLAVFNGRGGLELVDNFRAGCAGIIPAPEACDVQLRIWRCLTEGDEAEAERLYREILPLIVFVMQSLDHLVCYGKRALALRLGMGAVHDRGPGVAPDAFGLGCLERHLTRLGPWPA